MFQIDKGTKTANVQRTIRFTEELFDRLSHAAMKTIFHLTTLFCNVANTLWTTWKKTTDFMEKSGKRHSFPYLKQDFMKD